MMMNDDNNNNNSNKDNNNNNNNDDDNKIIFFEMLHSLDLVDSVPPWYSPSEPRPVNQNDQAQAFWDVPVYADHVTVRANRVDARIVDSTATSVTLLEMSCQGDQELWEDGEVCPTATGIEEAVSWISSEAI